MLSRKYDPILLMYNILYIPKSPTKYSFLICIVIYCMKELSNECEFQEQLFKCGKNYCIVYNLQPVFAMLYMCIYKICIVILSTINKRFDMRKKSPFLVFS